MLKNSRLPALTISAIGVVFGDIGTSPLYSLRECFSEHYGLAVNVANVYGITSLIFWSLVLIIGIKYILIVLRADNEGEGGILAMLALLNRQGIATSIILVGSLFGSALLYGDGVITPAISVLSAVEGLEILSPQLTPYVMPITIGILLALFLIQSRGTSRIGRVFGPVTLIWFLVLAALGIAGIFRHPDILWAADPRYAYAFFNINGTTGLLVLGSVFLVVTGGEALYADMGHFGTGPIRLGWFAVVMPSLLLHYFGQSAHLLAEPAAAPNPFYSLVPRELLIPVILLATMATIIASQAVITGVFSLTFQAVQMGFLPRFAIRHMSVHERGQIYIPVMNIMMLIVTVLIVLGFRTSSAIAGAYGIAVTLTMTITTLLLMVVLYKNFHWHPVWIGILSFIFLLIELAFLSANSVKIADGGWFPLSVGLGLLMVMLTWRRGRELLAREMAHLSKPVAYLNRWLSTGTKSPARVTGTAVYLTNQRGMLPPALVLNATLNRSLHKSVILVHVQPEPVPRVHPDSRFEWERLPYGFRQLVIHHGFMDTPDIPALLHAARHDQSQIDLNNCIYVLGRETILPTEKRGMAMWREHLFAFLSRNAHRATSFYNLPSGRVVEIGAQIEI